MSDDNVLSKKERDGLGTNEGYEVITMQDCQDMTLLSRFCGSTDESALNNANNANNARVCPTVPYPH